MKKRLLVERVVAISLLFSVCLTRADLSFAQPPGNITVFADPAASSCFASDNAAGSLILYIFHTNFSGMLTSNFRIAESSGFHAIYASETIAVPAHVGDFRSGVLLGYGECQGGSLLLGTLTYTTLGTSVPCSYLDVVAAPPYPWPATESCSFEDYPALPLGKLYVNPGAACQMWCTVATEQSTWGKIKAMYRR
jgi:hypothetical protein